MRLTSTGYLCGSCLLRRSSKVDPANNASRLSALRREGRLGEGLQRALSGCMHCSKTVTHETSSPALACFCDLYASFPYDSTIWREDLNS